MDMRSTSSAPNSPAPMSRRQFLKTSTLRAGAVAAAATFPQIVTRAANVNDAAPNILFIICDQWRFPQHLTPDERALLDARLPNYAWLRDRSVRFISHYAAAAAKFASYNYWKVGSIELNDSERQELELYDYLTPEGRLELDNRAGTRPWLIRELQDFIRHEVLPRELRRPLPEAYQAVHETAVAAYIDGIQIPNSTDGA
jgi:hypothetical protein